MEPHQVKQFNKKNTPAQQRINSKQKPSESQNLTELKRSYSCTVVEHRRSSANKRARGAPPARGAQRIRRPASAPPSTPRMRRPRTCMHHRRTRARARPRTAFSSHHATLPAKLVIFALVSPPPPSSAGSRLPSMRAIFLDIDGVIVRAPTLNPSPPQN